MAKYTKQELSELLDQPMKNINAWCSPSKRTLILDDNKLIDTEILKNKIFIDRKLSEKFEAVDKAVFKTKEPKAKTKEPKTIEEEAKPLPPTRQQKQQQELHKIDLETKKLTLRKIQKDLELKEIDIKKKNGNLIEADSIVGIISTYADTFKSELEQQLQVAVRDICNRHSVEKENAMRYVASVTSMINNCNEKAVTDVKNNFEKLTK